MGCSSTAPKFLIRQLLSLSRSDKLCTTKYLKMLVVQRTPMSAWWFNLVCCCLNLTANVFARGEAFVRWRKTGHCSEACILKEFWRWHWGIGHWGVVYCNCMHWEEKWRLLFGKESWKTRRRLSNPSKRTPIIIALNLLVLVLSVT